MSVEIKVLLDYIFGLREKFRSIYNVKGRYLTKNPMVLGKADDEKVKKLLEEIRGKKYSGNSGLVFEKGKIVWTFSEIKTIYPKIQKYPPLSKEFQRRLEGPGDDFDDECLCVNCEGVIKDKGSGCEACDWWVCGTCNNKDPDMLKNHEHLHLDLKEMGIRIWDLSSALGEVTSDFLEYEDSLLQRNRRLLSKIQTLEQENEVLRANELVWRKRKELQEELEAQASEGCPDCREKEDKIFELETRQEVVMGLFREFSSTKKRKRESEKNTGSQKKPLIKHYLRRTKKARKKLS